MVQEKKNKQNQQQKVNRIKEGGGNNSEYNYMLKSLQTNKI